MMRTKKILYVQYTNPAGYPPLEHSSRLLAEEGWEVLFLGTGAFGADSMRFPSHANITVKQIAFCHPGWRQKLHYLGYCFWVLYRFLIWHPGWIYASDLWSCPIALFLSFLPNVKVVYHEHDSPNEIAHSLFIRFCLNARKTLAHRAKICILPNKERVKHFNSATGRETDVFCVWNCPLVEEMAPVAINDYPKQKELWLYYHGSITPPQLPSSLLQALTLLPDLVKLRVVGYETIGNKGYVDHLLEAAQKLGLSERLEFLGFKIMRKELFDICSKAHIGIVLFSKPTREPMVGASNKPFDYLACGLALLVSDLPDWKKMYVEPGYGLACDPDSPESIAQALRWFYEHREETRQMGERGRQRILNEWNYERSFMPVLRLLEGNNP